jgi:hypothetical protein
VAETADGMPDKDAGADWADVHARGRLLDLVATMQTTPSGDTTAVQLKPSISSRTTTRRGPKIRGVDLNFAPCRPLKPFDFLGGFVGFRVS